MAGGILQRRIEELSKMFGISGHLDMPFQKCSSGYKQRASLARALLHDPKILLIDELNKSIDTEFAAAILAILSERSRNNTVVFSAHNQAVLNGFNGSLIKLNKGNIAG